MTQETLFDPAIGWPYAATPGSAQNSGARVPRCRHCRHCERWAGLEGVEWFECSKSKARHGSTVGQINSFSRACYFFAPVSK